MLKMLVMVLLGASILQTSALAQTRGQRDRHVPTRGEVERRVHNNHHYPVYAPPPVVVYPQYPSYPSYPNAYEVKLSRLRANYYIIEDFARGLSPNCYVKLNVSGWANQIYLYGNIRYDSGRFAGNFDNRSQIQYLRDTLINYVMDGTCLLPGY